MIHIDITLNVKLFHLFPERASLAKPENFLDFMLSLAKRKNLQIIHVKDMYDLYHK